jgi:hypothetical protein
MEVDRAPQQHKLLLGDGETARIEIVCEGSGGESVYKKNPDLQCYVVVAVVDQ